MVSSLVNASELTSSVSSFFATLTQGTLHHLSQRSLEESSDIIQAFFEMFYRFLLFCLPAVFTPSLFSSLLELSIGCLDQPVHRESTRAVREHQLISYATIIEATCITGYAHRMLLCVVRGLAHTSTGLYQHLSELLLVILESIGSERGQ